VASTRESILLSFQKWYKRRESEIDEAKESIVGEGKRLTLSKLNSFISSKFYIGIIQSIY
jgi:hypothetical protein